MAGGLTAASQRAFYDYHGYEWPTCECHGLPRRWNKDARRRAGGCFHCAEEGRGHARKYSASDSGRKTRRKYRHSDKGREVRRKWADSEEGRKSRRNYDESHVRVNIAGLRFRYHVPPEKKETVKALLSDFRASQSVDYAKEADSGWID